MLKNDYMKEVENSLRILKMDVDKSLADKDIELAKALINKQFRALIGLDIDTISTLSFNTIKNMLSKENQYNAEKFIALGELLKLEGIVSEKENDIALKVFYYKKVIEAFNEGYEEDNSIDKKFLTESIDVIEDLKLYDIGIKYEKYIFRIYELLGKFDKAEDMLFQIIDESNKDKSIISEGIAFYNRLKELSNKDLEDGNLSLEEVRESYNELKRL